MQVQNKCLVTITKAKNYQNLLTINNNIMIKSFTKIMIVVLTLLPITFWGQNNDKLSQFNDYVYVSGDLGLGLLAGDNSGLKAGLNGHVGIGYQFDNILGIKTNLGFGGLNGKYESLTLDKQNYFEANINLTVNLMDVILGYNPDRKFNVTPHVGFGQIQYKTTKLNDNGETVSELGNQGNSGRKVVATVPMGLELNYAINPSWKIFADFTANFTDSDRLDGVASGVHNDWFSSFNLGATYKLSKHDKLFNVGAEYCNYWFAMVDGGASFIFGDNDHKFNDLAGNGNVGIGYNFHDFYRVYAKVGYGIYKGSLPGVFTLDYSDYIEANINFSADIVAMIFGQNDARRFGIYPHIGIGQMQYRARATYADGEKAYVGYDHDAAGNKKGNGLFNRRVALTVPMGVELTYKMNEKIDIYVDATTNFADSDILDCFYSGTSKDYHSTMNFGLRYKFKNTCAKAADEAALEDEKDDCCVTPEELKQAIKEALEEQAAQDTVVEVKTEIIEKTYHVNHANIVFPVNKSEKLATQTNIDALNRASNEVQNGFEVESIIVEGYASPEGGQDINNRLAEERAQAAADLVQSELHTHLDANHVTIHSNGADWEGLVNAILGSDLKNKEDIANKIKNSSNKEQTLNELMGQYPQIRELLPQLRRANVTIKTVK